MRFYKNQNTRNIVLHSNICEFPKCWDCREIVQIKTKWTENGILSKDKIGICFEMDFFQALFSKHFSIYTKSSKFWVIWHLKIDSEIERERRRLWKKLRKKTKEHNGIMQGVGCNEQMHEYDMRCWWNETETIFHLEVFDSIAYDAYLFSTLILTVKRYM